MVHPAALIGIVAAALLAISPAAATQSAANLIENPGAEASDGPSCTSNTGFAPPVGWQVTGHFTALQNDCSPPLGGVSGSRFFAGGDGGDSSASQTVDLAANAAAIDAGTAKATLGALLGGYESQRDSATVVVTFHSGTGSALGSLKVGPVTVAERNGKSVLLARSTTGIVPRLSRTARVVISADYVDGAVYNDGYADDISLTLAASATVTPSATTAGSPTKPLSKFTVRMTFRGAAGNLFRPSKAYIRNGARVTICSHALQASRHPFTFSRANRFSTLLRPGKCMTKRFVNPTKRALIVTIYDRFNSQTRLELVIAPR